MTTTTPHRRLTGWLVFALCLTGLLMTLTFRTQAQTTTAPKKGKQGTTQPQEKAAPSSGQHDANGRIMEMDGMSRAQLEKAQLELERAAAEMAKQDWKKVESEIARAKAEAERAIKASEADFEMETMQKAMAEVEKSLAKQQVNIEKEMKKAEGQIRKAQEQIGLMEQGMELMEKDGLIRPGESIQLEWEEDSMILNGKKQSKEVSDKYRKYFKHKKQAGNDKSSVVI